MADLIFVYTPRMGNFKGPSTNSDSVESISNVFHCYVWLYYKFDLVCCCVDTKNTPNDIWLTETNYLTNRNGNLFDNSKINYVFVNIYEQFWTGPRQPVVA